MRALAFVSLALLLNACDHDSIRMFPKYTESQNEWLQSHCRITFIGEVDSGTKLVDFKREHRADIVERLAASESTVQLVAYQCSAAVPEAVARGEK